MNHYRLGIGHIKPPSSVGLVDILNLEVIVLVLKKCSISHDGPHVCTAA